MFSGFGEVSELLKQIIAESDEGVPEGVVLEESDEDTCESTCVASWRAKKRRRISRAWHRMSQQSQR